MSREEVQAFLRNFQQSLDGLQKQIDQSLRELPGVKREDLPKFLAQQKARWLKFQEDELDEWRKFVEETGLEAEEASVQDEGEAASAQVTPFNVRLRSLESRVAAMGGIPALGGFVLPRMTPGQKAGLVATSSPAAVEILRGRLGTDADAQTRLRRTASGDDDTVATPLVQLRKTVLTNNAAAAGGGGGGSGGFMGTPGIAGPNSELAAAIQRRAQRQQQLEAAEAAA